MDSTLLVDLDFNVSWSCDGSVVTIHDVTVGNKSVMSKLSDTEMKDLKDHLSGEVADKETAAISFEGVEVEVDFSYYKGSKDYFDKSMEQWMPGDPSSVDIKTIKLGGIDITDDISTNEYDAIHEKIIEMDLGESLNFVKEHFDKIMDKLDKKLNNKLNRGKLKAKLGKKEKSKVPGFSYWFQK